MLNFKGFLEMQLEQPWDRSSRRGPYWGDSAAGILLIAENTGRLLVNERSGNVDGGRSFGIYGGGFWLEEGEEFEDVDPRTVALHELEEEAGISFRPSRIDLLYDFHDQRYDWHYWSYLGFVPQETPVRPGSSSRWEGEGGSGWYTYKEFMALNPKHPGLKMMVEKAGNKILMAVKSLGFTGEENYKVRGNRQKSTITRTREDLRRRLSSRNTLPPEFPKP